MRRARYSIQLIRDGKPEPKGYRAVRPAAIEYGRELAAQHNLEVRVWATRAAKVIATIKPREVAHAG